MYIVTKIEHYIKQWNIHKKFNKHNNKKIIKLIKFYKNYFLKIKSYIVKIDIIDCNHIKIYYLKIYYIKYNKKTLSISFLHNNITYSINIKSPIYLLL